MFLAWMVAIVCLVGLLRCEMIRLAAKRRFHEIDSALASGRLEDAQEILDAMPSADKLFGLSNVLNLIDWDFRRMFGGGKNDA